MAMKRCPICGEKYSDTYKSCPFCEEDEAFANGGKKPVNPGRRVHRQKSPSILGPTLVLVLVLVEAEPDLSSALGVVLDRQPVRVAAARTLAMSAVSFFFICF